MSAETLGLESAGPEILMCRDCHQMKETPFQRCGRCKGPPYCSVQCQKADWRRHKPNCNGRVEAMKLSSEELALLDQYTNDFTQGTGELKCWSHAGTLVPEVQQAMILDRQLVDFAAKKAKERRRAMHEGQDEVKDKLLTEEVKSQVRQNTFLLVRDGQELGGGFYFAPGKAVTTYHDMEQHQR